jgi:branched-chain amino acid aminotransferase
MRVRGSGVESAGSLAPVAADGPLTYVNGRVVPREEALISVYDSGLNFGDGVFEGIRVYGGRVLRLDEHLQRLFESARALSIEVGMGLDELRAEVLRWLRANEVLDDYHFRPIVTRGERFPPRLDPRYCTGPATILMVGGPIADAVQPLRVAIASTRRPAPDAFDAKIKSLNYGNTLLARLEAIRQGLDDAFLLDSAGFLAEATTSNVFVVRAGHLLTPLPKACLEGITRGIVMELATRAGYEVRERDISPSELINAEEIFLAGTATQVTPVVEVNGSRIGAGRPGPISTEMAAAYERLVRAEGTPIWEA